MTPLTNGLRATCAAALTVPLLAGLLVAAPAQADARDADPGWAASSDLLPAPNPDIELPTGPAAPAVLDTGAGDLTMALPSATGSTFERSAGERVFGTRSGEASIAVQSTAKGLRALISIDSADAPERYRFDMGGDVSKVELMPDGGAAAVDDAGVVIATAPAPWAVDAAGVDVPTHFEVSGGNTLVQVVEHKAGSFQYGITADPWWNPFSWPWGKWVKKASSAVSKALTKCGYGVLVGALGLGLGTGTTNLLIEKTAQLKMVGWQGYVGAAAAGCIINMLK